MCQLESGAQLHERDPVAQGGEIRTHGDAPPSIKASIPRCSDYTPTESKQRSHQPQNNSAGGADGERVHRARSEKHATKTRPVKGEEPLEKLHVGAKKLRCNRKEEDQARMGEGRPRPSGSEGSEVRSMDSCSTKSSKKK